MRASKPGTGRGAGKKQPKKSSGSTGKTKKAKAGGKKQMNSGAKDRKSGAMGLERKGGATSGGRRKKSESRGRVSASVEVRDQGKVDRVRALLGSEAEFLSDSVLMKAISLIENE